MIRKFKIILISMILFIHSQSAWAKTIADYYNMIDKNDQRIKQAMGKWYFKGIVEDLEISNMDIENGYFEVNDPGTGGGMKIITSALFLKKNGGSVVVEFIKAGFGATFSEEYRINAYIHERGSMMPSDNIMPKSLLNRFFKRGYSFDKINSLGWKDAVKIHYQLPRHGTTIEASLDYGYLSWAVSNKGDSKITEKQEDAIREFLSNIKYKVIRLMWDPQGGRFVPDIS